MNEADSSHTRNVPMSAMGALLTMSSLEIAELTGREHRNVMRDIRNMLDGLGEGGVLSFEQTHRNPQNGQEYPISRLPKRECIILVSGYDVTMRARIVDRWLELEAAVAAPKLPDLSDPAVLTTLLLEHAAKRIEAEQRAAEAESMVGMLQTKSEAYDRLAESHGTFCRSTAAKMLGVPPLTLTRWLRTNGWTFRRPGDKDDLAYQSKIAAGLLEHKVTTGQRPDGSEWSSTQVRVTAKGLTGLARAFPPAVREAGGVSRRGMVAGIAAAAMTALGFSQPAPARADTLVSMVSTQFPPFGSARLAELDRYLVFLAHEHRAALAERFSVVTAAGLTWAPPAADVERMIESAPPSRRALLVLLAARVPGASALLDRAEQEALSRAS